MTQSQSIKDFFALVCPGFSVEGEIPDVRLDGIEVLSDARAVAMVQADGRTLPIRFTFDDGKIARVEVL